jgi:hypothetical protein
MASVTGSFTATGQSSSFSPLVSARSTSNAFNVALWGTASVGVQLERTFDNGTTWVKIYAGSTQLYKWTYDGSTVLNISEVVDEPEQGVLYRLNCTTYTSGTLNYRISQGQQ